MKRLFLLRHAQTLPHHGGHDSERVLSPKGYEDLAKLAPLIAALYGAPDLVLCSPVSRTIQTFAGALPNYAGKAEKPKILYSGSAGDYFSLIQNAPDDAGSLLLIAHNPAIYELAARLSPKGKNSALARLGEGYAPATLSVIDAPFERWADIDPDLCSLTELHSPIDYNAPERPTRWM